MMPHHVPQSLVAIFCVVHDLPRAEQVDALIRAARWSWYAGLRAHGDERRGWAMLEMQLRGARAWRMMS